VVGEDTNHGNRDNGIEVVGEDIEIKVVGEDIEIRGGW
jgi:hypothetical protein